VWAEDGDAAQREIDAVLPDAILLDWMLPGQTAGAGARWRATRAPRRSRS
jgi:two-component system phosphate regulon response regulator PhoB